MAADQLNAIRKETLDLIVAYLNLTRDVLPGLARQNTKDWPVSADHCFQRIVLDNVCGGVWYNHLGRPAYKHLTHDQAQSAVDLCKAIASGRVDIKQLNKQSLIWRGKWRDSK